MKHYSFPKIRQYHQVIRDIKLNLSYVGKDDNGDAIYKEPDSWGEIVFKGHVKLHGTNSSIVFSPDGSFYCQSRERVIDEISDNAGFAHWVNKEGFKIFDQIKNLFFEAEKIVLFGEWCGGSIQKGVALNQLSKMFVVFGAKCVFKDESTLYFDSSGVKNHEINVFNISEAPTYKLVVDLDRPDKAIEEINSTVEEIDKECPFSKMFGVSGHGEGIVFKEIGDFGFSRAFKVKGESHTISKIKKLPSVDTQKVDGILEAVSLYCNEDRMEQIFNKVVLTEADKVPQKIGEFIKSLVDDAWEEEGDSIRDSDISRKEFGTFASKVAAKWFQKKIQEFN